MLKEDEYYYSDAMYQLEINLQKVRKELITMLEIFEQTDCKNCLLLKCKCPKTDVKIYRKYTKDRQPNRNRDIKSNYEPCDNKVKVQVSLPATALLEPKWKNDQSPATCSTPEKLTEAEDIETWMEASMKVEKEDNFEKVVLNPKKSLVTIENVRPADLPLKTLQKSCILNSSSFLKSSTSNLLNDSNLLNHLNISNSQNISENFVNSATLEAFYKYLKPRMNDTNVVYTSAKQDKNKQYYSYF